MLDNNLDGVVYVLYKNCPLYLTTNQTIFNH